MHHTTMLHPLAWAHPGGAQANRLDLTSFVVSLNLHRRHLTTSQRATIAANLAEMSQGLPKTGQLAGLENGQSGQQLSQREAAQMLNVGGSVEGTGMNELSDREKAIRQQRRAITVSGQ